MSKNNKTLEKKIYSVPEYLFSFILNCIGRDLIIQKICTSTVCSTMKNEHLVLFCFSLAKKGARAKISAPAPDQILNWLRLLLKKPRLRPAPALHPWLEVCTLYNCIIQYTAAVKSL